MRYKCCVTVYNIVRNSAFRNTSDIYYDYRVSTCKSIKCCTNTSPSSVYVRYKTQFHYSSLVMVSVTATRKSYVMSCTAMNVAQRMICCVHSLYRPCQRRRERLIQVLVLTWHLNPAPLIFQRRAFRISIFIALLDTNTYMAKFVIIE